MALTSLLSLWSVVASDATKNTAIKTLKTQNNKLSIWNVGRYFFYYYYQKHSYEVEKL